MFALSEDFPVKRFADPPLWMAGSEQSQHPDRRRLIKDNDRDTEPQWGGGRGCWAKVLTLIF